MRLSASVLDCGLRNHVVAVRGCGGGPQPTPTQANPRQVSLKDADLGQFPRVNPATALFATASPSLRVRPCTPFRSTPSYRSTVSCPRSSDQGYATATGVCRP